MKGGIEHRYLRQIGKQCQRGVDALQVGGIVQRRQRRGRTNRCHRQRIDAAGGGKVFAAMHHAMADAGQLRAGDCLHQGQQLLQRSKVVGAGQRDALFLAVLLPVQCRLRRAQAFGQAVQWKSRLLWIDQSEFD